MTLLSGPRPTTASPRRLRTWWTGLDHVLVASASALSVLGCLLVWTATRAKMDAAGGDPQSYLKRQVLNVVIGFAIFCAVATLSHRQLRTYAPILYAGCLLALVVVLSPLGVEVNGAHAWLALPGGFSLQPSEFAKVAIVVGMAFLLTERIGAEAALADDPVALRDLVRALALAGVPMALIMLQPDLGTDLVIASMVFAILLIAGTSAKWLLGLVGAAALVVIVAIQVGFLDQYQVDRLTAFTDPAAGAKTFGYNTQQARIAIGNGGFLGEGLFHGEQTQGGFVPYQQTDFVFSAAGEELGYLGAGLLILLLGLICWRGIRIALNAEDMFGRLVATGVVAWLAFQTFENIGMNLGIMPVTGVPLPFISYGGSSMFATWAGIGLLQLVHARRT